MSEIEVHQAPGAELVAQMSYAKAVAPGDLLPETYRDKPANVMLAVGLGQSMGLSPAESLYRISIIQGKPTASAELIAANVRKAGHKLRVLTDHEAVSVKAVIVRADDPDFAFEVVRDMAWAEQMELAKSPNYRKQPTTMLQWRAITACARIACPEALYGVAYTADEMGDLPRTTSQQRPASSTAEGGLAAAIRAEQTPAHTDDDGDRDQTAGEAVGVTGTVVTEGAVADDGDAAASSPLLDTSSQLATDMFEAMTAAGIGKQLAPEFFTETVGRPIASSKELTEDEARRVLDHLPQQETDQ